MYIHTSTDTERASTSHPICQFHEAKTHERSPPCVDEAQPQAADS